MMRVSALMLGPLLLVHAPHAQGECRALEGAQVWLPGGVVDTATVIVEGGRISSVIRGTDPVHAPAGCARIDLTGQVLTPGFVDPYTHLGLVEIGMEAASRDHFPGADTVGKLSVRPSFQIWPAYNPRSSLIPVARLGGVTGVLTTPTGGRVSGQSAWVDLIEPTELAADALAQSPLDRGSKRFVTQPDAVAVHVHLGGGEGSRAEAHWDLKLLLQEARLWAQRRREWERNQHRPFRFPGTELEAMQPVLKRERVLAIHADRASDIEGALSACSGLRWVLMGGAEAWSLAGQLARSGVTVVVDPLLNAPESFDRLRARPDNAALLAEAGVPVALSTFSSHNVRTLRQGAGNAVRAGLSPAAARVAITEVPAAAFGRPDHGRVAVGAVANLVAWSGDPFEFSSRPQHIWVRGRSMPMTSRQTRLRDRYRELPGSPSSPLPLP